MAGRCTTDGQQMCDIAPKYRTIDPIFVIPRFLGIDKPGGILGFKAALSLKLACA
jgi:hypothetical protein